MIRRKNIALAAVLAFAFSAFLGRVSAQASSATATFTVSASVLTACTIVALPLAFGTYVSTAASTATTTLTVLCTLGGPYTVGLNAGTGSGATVTTRKMTNTVTTTSTLNYGLYSDSGYSVVWGNTIGTNTVAGNGSGLAQILTVYGSMPSGQTGAAFGSFMDTITATINY